MLFKNTLMGIDVSEMHAEISSIFLQVLLSVLLLVLTILNSKFLLFFFHSVTEPLVVNWILCPTCLSEEFLNFNSRRCFSDLRFMMKCDNNQI